MLPIANQTTGPIGTLMGGRSVLKAKIRNFFFNFFSTGNAGPSACKLYF